MESKVEASAPKVTVTALEESNSDSSSIENGFQPPERRVVQANLAILAGVLLPCIPIVAVSAALLGILFYHRVDLNPGHAELHIPTNEVDKNITNWITLIRKQGGEWAYYVEYNPSTLTTIASWTSRVLPWCASSIMALVAFYAARHIVLKSHRGNGSDLPNPQQLTILINVLGGSSWGPIKDTVLHRYRSRERLVSPLPLSTLALFAITLLGLIIPILDSWFGIATTAPIVTQLYPRDAQLSFGRQLSSSDSGSFCQGNPRGTNDCIRQNTFWPCNVWNYECYPVASLLGVGDAPKITQDASSNHKAWNYTDASGTNYYYLGSPNQDALVDFKAHTFATSTQCVPITHKCYKYSRDDNSNFEDAGIFNCTDEFHGSLYSNILRDSPEKQVSPNIGVAFAQNPELTVVGDVVNGPSADDVALRAQYTFPKLYTTNPLYFGAWAIGYPQADPVNTLASPFASDDKGIAWAADLDPGNGATWQLNCSTTVYDVSYTWIDGAVHTFNKTKSTTDMAALLSAPFAYAANLSAIPLALSSVAQTASVLNTSVGLANAFADEMSKTMLAYAIGAMEPKLNLLEQGRNSTLHVARVPIVPLYLLLATKAVFVVVVLVLAVGAYCFSHPSETEAVRSALSAKGLAAAHFQSPDLMQSNVVKEVQSRLEAVRGAEPPQQPPTPHEKHEAAQQDLDDDMSSRPKLQHAATAPVQGNLPAREARVGLLPAADGSWQFVMVANGVWNSIKPIVKSIVVSDAAAGGLGDVGKVITAWK
ncbi:hypothetical protein A1O1_07898 [Capronia coronata CBS 617.96]|uniref:Uncharacterized protein n=1 Tax=Capronia coronata CBS 617.96 TaxID=1182541 RepID=W9XNR1_9EURO|nr:uncharacterized protein A1O1_07898 [Capronia coronata CBS 617.96]EXJ81833.1 hypothetical protein A1O1_07898 [Capronia coronata CBS 617.96]